MRKRIKKGSATADQSKAEPDYQKLEKELLEIVLNSKILVKEEKTMEGTRWKK